MAPTEKKAPDWREIVEQLVKAEKDAVEWRSEADRAEKDVIRLKAQLARALRVNGGGRAQALVAEALGGSGKPTERTRDTARPERILKLFTERGGYLTLVELLKLEGCTKGAAHGVLFRLAREGKIQKLPGIKGRYALTRTSEGRKADLGP